MENSIILNQGDDKIIQTKRTIDWLVNNTEVAVFNPMTFSGYQRQIDQKHCDSIVRYLKDNIYMPSSIICACDKDYTEDTKLRIVDGQHRIQAFSKLRDIDPDRYGQIKESEMALNVLLNPSQEKEIAVFININKKTKKVDTSLAYVLRSKLTKAGDDAMSRAEYLSVEAACRLNESGICDLWTNRILFEGNLRSTESFISLNAFVRATRIFVNLLEKSGLISYNWQTAEELSYNINVIVSLLAEMWQTVYQRWPDLRKADIEDKQILQGSIGYTAILRTIVRILRQTNISSPTDVSKVVSSTIMNFDVPSSNWIKGGYYSNYSSETGYKIVSDDLLHGSLR